jgi:hypothetical protein
MLGASAQTMQTAANNTLADRVLQFGTLPLSMLPAPKTSLAWCQFLPATLLHMPLSSRQFLLLPLLLEVGWFLG